MRVPALTEGLLPACACSTPQVLLLKDFKDFPAEELTLEFWCAWAAPPCPACR